MTPHQGGNRSLLFYPVTSSFWSQTLEGLFEPDMTPVKGPINAFRLLLWNYGTTEVQEQDKGF